MLTNVMIGKTVKQHLYNRLARLVDYCPFARNRVARKDLGDDNMIKKLVVNHSE